ncbi:hypothetical protein ES702_00956 [subsurface metagenome]
MVIIVGFLTFLAIVVGVVIAQRELRLTTNTRRAEFLNVLDHRFCTEEGFTQIRREIRNGQLTINPDNEMMVSDYLGFFEVLSVFRRSGILSDHEIYSQFGAYIIEAKNNKAIHSLLRSEQGFWSGFREIAQRMEEISAKYQ